jgi:hypothetical protein
MLEQRKSTAAPREVPAAMALSYRREVGMSSQYAAAVRHIAAAFTAELPPPTKKRNMLSYTQTVMGKIVFSGYTNSSNGAKAHSKVWALIQHQDGTTSTAWSAYPIRAATVRISCRKSLRSAAVHALIQSKRTKGYRTSAPQARAFQKWLKARARDDAVLVMCPKERAEARRRALADTPPRPASKAVFVFYHNPEGNSWHYANPWAKRWTGKGSTQKSRYPAEEQFHVSHQDVNRLRDYLRGFFTKLRDAKKIVRFKIRSTYTP